MSTIPEPAARHYGRRADAERNRESVLDHAARLLSDDPAAGMAEIAAASGVNRATLYRHFSSRELLLEAITVRAADDVERAIADSRLDEGRASEALHRLIAALLEVGDRYRFLLLQDTVRAPAGQRRAYEERLGDPVAALFERGRIAGEFSRSLSAEWMTAAFGAMLAAVVHQVADGRLDQSQAEATATATLLFGLAERPDSEQKREA